MAVSLPVAGARPASEIAGRVDGLVTPIDDQTCLLKLASDSLDLHLRKLSERFANAVTHLR